MTTRLIVCPACSDVAWPKHQKMCTAEKPFRAAGTGLGKESLSTKLVPGKIAGSMHSNLPAREVAITAASQAQDLPSMSSLDINKQVSQLQKIFLPASSSPFPPFPPGRQPCPFILVIMLYAHCFWTCLHASWSQGLHRLKSCSVLS